MARRKNSTPLYRFHGISGDPAPDVVTAILNSPRHDEYLKICEDEQYESLSEEDDGFNQMSEKHKKAAAEDQAGDIFYSWLNARRRSLLAKHPIVETIGGDGTTPEVVAPAESREEHAARQREEVEARRAAKRASPEYQQRKQRLAEKRAERQERGVAFAAKFEVDSMSRGEALDAFKIVAIKRWHLFYEQDNKFAATWSAFCDKVSWPVDPAVGNQFDALFNAWTAFMQKTRREHDAAMSAAAEAMATRLRSRSASPAAPAAKPQIVTTSFGNVDFSKLDFTKLKF